MKEFKEVIDNIKNLSETIEEAVAYVNTNIKSENKDMIETVIFDIIDALDSINNALLPIVQDEENDVIIQSTKTLRLSLSNLSEAISKNTASDEIFNGIIKNFSDWKFNIDKLSKANPMS